jgi:predicted FMN-binding regulatory protein PaiB
MYPLKPFQSTDLEKMHAVMEAHPLATLISQDTEWPVITQVPLILERGRGERGFLRGHFDGNNPHGPLLAQSPHVVVLFQGPNHYMSPSIYPTPHYPGWNYYTVHVRARAHVVKDRERVRASLFRLAELHEPLSSGYQLSSAQKNFEVYLDMIFGFELEILEARAIFKLAQDKGKDHAEIAAGHLAGKVRETDVLPLLTLLLK